LALTTSIFTIGYSQGQVDFAQDPETFAKEARRRLLLASGATKEMDNDSADYMLVEHVGNQVIASALAHAKAKLRECETSSSTYDRLKPPGAGAGSLDQATESAFWRRAVKILSGRWRFVVGDSPSVNAFVSDLAPRQVFVLRGLLTKLGITPDELAMCLAHELAHSILGHGSEKANTEVILTGFQLVFLVAFPDSFTYLNDFLVAGLRAQLSNSFSRTCEEEADALGSLIASRACYDPTTGAMLFTKLGSLAGPDMYLSTHPLSSSRVAAVRALAEQWKTDPHLRGVCRGVRADYKAATLAKLVASSSTT
jgi:Zn-dependent protease with chaperone function